MSNIPHLPAKPTLNCVTYSSQTGTTMQYDKSGGQQGHPPSNYIVMGNIPPNSLSAFSLDKFYSELEAWHKSVFEGAVEVGCHYDLCDKGWQAGTKFAPNKISHKGLLVNIQPVKEKSATDIIERMLYAIVHGFDSTNQVPQMITEAKTFLERNK